MSLTDRFLAYLQHYARRDLDAIAAMVGDDIRLRDWNIAVTGRAAMLAETAKNFAAARSIEIEVLSMYAREDAVAGELRIVVDGTEELCVVDVVQFGADGKITAIRAYRGRGDAPATTSPI